MTTHTKLKLQILAMAGCLGILVIAVRLAMISGFTFYQLTQSSAEQRKTFEDLQQQQKKLEIQLRLGQQRAATQNLVADQNRKLRAALQQRVDDTQGQRLSEDDQRLVSRLRNVLAGPPDGAEQNEKLRVALKDALAAAELRERRESHAEIEREVAEVRGMPFRTPVVYETMETSDFPMFVRQQIREEHSEEEFRDYARALTFLGLLPAGTDLEQVLLSVLGEQVGAFYDEKKRRLVTFPDRPSSSGVDTMILAHELTHALDDQYFPIKELGIHVKDNDDRALAVLSLIEGNATMVMGQVYLKRAGQSGLASALKDFNVMFWQNTEQFQRAPLFVQQSLVFPYLQGQQFVLALMTRGGTNAVNDAYRHPPSCTTQILHPEKYFERHDPSEIAWPDFAQRKSWKLLSCNVVGEFGIQILLSLQLDAATAHRAAAGWDGDRYAVYEIAPHRLAMLWVSHWENDAEAREFSDALTAWAQKKGRNLFVHRNDLLQTVGVLAASDEETMKLLKQINF